MYELPADRARSREGEDVTPARSLPSLSVRGKRDRVHWDGLGWWR
jgi:hypothetical protein